MIGKSALHLLEQRHRPQAGRGLKHRANLAVPETVEGIGSSTPQLVFPGLRGRQMVRGLDAAGFITTAGPEPLGRICKRVPTGAWERRSTTDVIEADRVDGGQRILL
jgi:hypothetical protein